MSTVQSYKTGTPCWLDLSSSNLPAAKEFYRALFDWEFVDMPIGSGMIYAMAKFKGEWVCGMMSQMPEQVQAGLPSVWAVYIAVEDADAAAAAVETAGGKILMPVDDVPNGSGRMVVAKDPGGASVGFWQAKSHHGTGIVNEIGTVVWHELTVADVPAVLPFYQTVAGMAAETSPMGDLGEYTRFTVDGESVAGAMQAQPGMPSAWTAYLAVENCDAALERIPELGGSVLSPAFDIPFGRMAVVADPAGAVFCVMELAEHPGE